MTCNHSTPCSNAAEFVQSLTLHMDGIYNVASAMALLPATQLQSSPTLFCDLDADNTCCRNAAEFVQSLTLYMDRIYTVASAMAFLPATQLHASLPYRA